MSIGYCSSATPESSGERCCSDRLNPQPKADISQWASDLSPLNEWGPPTLWASMLAFARSIQGKPHVF